MGKAGNEFSNTLQYNVSKTIYRTSYCTLSTYFVFYSINFHHLLQFIPHIFIFLPTRKQGPSPDFSSRQVLFLISLLVSLHCRFNQMCCSFDSVPICHLRKCPCHFHRHKSTCHFRIATDWHVIIKQHIQIRLSLPFTNL